jgi:hypothetical protein
VNTLVSGSSGNSHQGFNEEHSAVRAWNNHVHATEALGNPITGSTYFTSRVTGAMMPPRATRVTGTGPEQPAVRIFGSGSTQRLKTTPRLSNNTVHSATPTPCPLGTGNAVSSAVPASSATRTPPAQVDHVFWVLTEGQQPGIYATMYVAWFFNSNVSNFLTRAEVEDAIGTAPVGRLHRIVGEYQAYRFFGIEYMNNNVHRN